jgi:prepilin-type N-terminal cleavage/methylation domain-containing protein
MKPTMPLKSEDGFSIVEVVAVLVILTIISAVIISNSGSFSTDLVSQTEILKTHLRYAQTMGMSGNTTDGIFGIKCDTSFYWMFKDVNPDSNIVFLPDDQRYNTNNDGKLDLSEKKIDIASAFTIFFDQRGIPYTAYTNETTNTPLAADFSIILRPDGEATPTETITITQHTGFIP